MKYLNKTAFSLIAGFITMGLIASFLGPLLEKAAVSLALDYGAKGYLLSAQFTGCILGIFLGIIAERRLSRKQLLITGALIMAAGLGAGAAAGSYQFFFAACIVIGTGLGVFEVGFNAFCLDYVALFPETSRISMTTIFHFFFGIGAICGPFLTESITKILGSWNFVLLALIAAPLGCLVLLSRAPNIGAKKPEGPSFVEKRPFSFIKSFPLLLVALLAAALYVGMESSVFGWITLFWAENIHQWPSFVPAYAASAFWFAFSFGRLTLGPAIEKIGSVVYVPVAGGLTFAVSLLWALFPGQAWICFAALFVMGLLFASLFPILLTMTNRMFALPTGVITGILVFCTTISAAVFPFFISNLADKTGLLVLPWIICGTAVLFSLVCSLFSISFIKDMAKHV